MIALTFATPLLLAGLAAAAIPFIIHLLSHVRAKQVRFPTLRFLRASMARTARRRRIQHWLLLILRAMLLAILAIAVAEPISRAAGDWLADGNVAAVVVLDNSYSMAATPDGASRFERARGEAGGFLSGDDRPALAAVLSTAGGFGGGEPTDRLERLREEISGARIRYGPARLADRVADAVSMLDGAAPARKDIYVFSDLQRSGFEELLELRDLTESEDINLFVISPDEPVRNVGISDLEISGRRIVDSPVTFTATLVNSSATDEVVEVSFRVDGRAAGPRVRRTLRAAGQTGSRTTVRFHHTFRQPGPASGAVVIETPDDLDVDNIRRFALRVADRSQAVVVGGGATESRRLDAVAMPRLALDPFEDRAVPWPVRSRTVTAEAFDERTLDGADAVYFCEVARFSEPQARATERFVRQGGTAVFFLGPETDVDNYNQRFMQEVPEAGGLLPGRLGGAVGEIGPDAPAVGLDWVDVDHPYFRGLYENVSDYLSVLVQRRFGVAPSPRGGRTLMRLATGEPLLIEKPFGRGKVLLCTTGSSTRWSKLPTHPVFLPMLVRTAIEARTDTGRVENYLAGSRVSIRPETAVSDDTGPITLTPPNGQTQRVVETTPTAEGLEATFTDTHRPGIYGWQIGTGDEPLDEGVFAVNPYGEGCDLRAFEPDEFIRAMRARGFERVYVAGTRAEALATAADAAEGRNWWDLLIAAVVLLLVVEAVVANRRGELPGRAPAAPEAARASSP